MRYVLTKPDQDLIIELLMSNAESELPEINSLMEGCRYYYFPIYGNTYFLAKTVQHDLSHDKFDENYIDNVYDLTNNNNLFLEDVNADFIDHILQSYSTDQDIDMEIHRSYESYLNRYH